MLGGLLLAICCSACNLFSLDCSDKDVQCDALRLLYSIQSVTPVLVVGDSLGQIHVSTDGLQWQTVAVDPGFQITDINWAAGVFRLTSANTVIVNRMFFSPDALAWGSSGSGLETGATFSGISFGNGRYIIIGANAAANFVFSSNDGFVWSPVSDPDFGAADFAPTPDADLLDFVGGLFVAGDIAGGDIFFSSDGLDWVKGLAATSNPSQFGKVGDYFFWSDAGALYAKTTLTGLVPAAVPGLVGIRGSASNIFGFGVAIGDAGAIHTTADGINWSANRNPAGGAQLTTATIEDPRLMLVGGAGGVYFLSTSGGATWQGPFTIPGAGNLRSAVTRPGFPYL